MSVASHIEASVGEVGTRIKALRKKRQWSQADLAKHLEVEQATVARWENSKRGLSISKLQRLADTFQVPVESLLEVDSQSPPRVAGPLPSEAAQGLVLHIAEVLGVTLASSDKRLLALRSDVLKFWEAFQGHDNVSNHRNVAVFFHQLRSAGVTENRRA